MDSDSGRFCHSRSADQLSILGDFAQIRELCGALRRACDTVAALQCQSLLDL
jgi:hypothetical protein